MDNNDISIRKSFIKLIHADGFFPNNDAELLFHNVKDLTFASTPYGLEIPGLSIIFPDINIVFSKMLGENIEIDKSRSGVIRKPMHIIHFEDFVDLNEWCFIIALEKTTFNIYQHVKDIRHNDYGLVDAKTALDGHQFNYLNLFEWDVVTNVVLERNQGVFFRPWCFHSLQNGLVQYYRLLSV
jgi:hypothetical protein